MKNAPTKAVNLWTWRRMFRDYGPEANVLLTLYTISTYMDRDGFCFVGQAKIADGARTSVRTVKRHIAEAKVLGWLHVELERVDGGRHVSFRNTYRACVPAHLDLPSEVDEELRDAVLSQYGDTDEGGDIAMAPRCEYLHEGGDISSRRWGHPASEGGDKNAEGGDIAMAQELFSLNSSVLTLQREGPLARSPLSEKSKKTKAKKKTEEPAHLSNVLPATARSEPKKATKVKATPPFDLEAERQRQLAGLRAKNGAKP